MITQIEAILNTYINALQAGTNVVGSHPAIQSLRLLAIEVRNTNLLRNNPYLSVKPSWGAGNYTKVPWVAIFDRRVTKSAQKGVYPVFLFKADMSGFYLSLSTATGVAYGAPNATRATALAAEAARLAIYFNELSTHGFVHIPAIDLAVSAGPGKGFQIGSVVHKFYSKNALPKAHVLLEDLSALLHSYNLAINNGIIPQISPISTSVPPLSVPFYEDVLEQINNDIAAASVVCSQQRAKRFITALLTKRFVILTGLAGSGKTKIAQVVCRWITPISNYVDATSRSNHNNINPYYALIPIGADWIGNENIIGYPDGLQATSYVAKPALDLILHAAVHAEVPHFLILDEMNLSHVERYFADILSTIESDEGLELYSGDMTKPETWRKTSAAMPVPPKLKHLPENLFIIGTVNVDETTYMFSPKVLDRANVIEFRMEAGELEGFLGNSAKPDLSKLDGKGAAFGKAFVDAAKNPVTVPYDVKADYDAEMLLLFKILQVHGAEFGYRTAYETARFIHFYKLLGNHADGDIGWFPGAFDCVVLQKLLPKLHGSRAKLGPLLKKLWFLCVNGPMGRGADSLKSAEEAARSTEKKAEPSVLVPDGAHYPLSAEKIGRMWRLLIENGFASFAEA